MESSGRRGSARLRTGMSRRRLFRLTTAFCAALALLFSQLALASYSCPGKADAEAMAEMMAAGMPCSGMDSRQPALCHQHAADPGKTVEAVKLPTVPLPLLFLVLELPVSIDVDAARAVPVAATPQARPPPDPLFLSTLRLRV
jgi:hypothetical protein